MNIMEDDLAGFVIQNNPQDVYVINIPAEAEENDVLGREPGDALLPEIGKDKEWLKSHKKNYISQEGLRSWNSLYQGQPKGKEGNIFKRKWFPIIDKKDLPSATYDNGKLVDPYAGMIHQVISVDATFKDTDGSDNVAIGWLGKRENTIYIEPLIGEKLDFISTVDALRNIEHLYDRLQARFIEDKANGSAIINMLSKDIPGIVPITPRESKLARAYACQGWCRSGNVVIVRNELTEPFLNELTSFPNGKHDDFVDMLTQGVNQLAYYYSELPEIPVRDDWEKFDKEEPIGYDKGNWDDTELDMGMFDDFN